MNLDAAVVYDLETLKNCFTCHFEALFSDLSGTFEISEYRDDREALFQWFRYWRANQTPMLGYNVISFDYPILHYIDNNPGCGVDDIYNKAQEQIRDRSYLNTVRVQERFAPQIDLYKLHHFDNRAKSTSLKALQFNMRCDSVLEMPLPFDVPISKEDVSAVLVPYGDHDVESTKQFALHSMDAIKFRIGLIETLGLDVLNFNDTKIGAKILEKRLGDELCYDWTGGRRAPRQTHRDRIPLADIIFPYVRFSNPEFQRILDWMRGQVISEDEVTGKLKTKGIFSGIHATVGGLDFHFGTGGIHGSVPAQRVVADEEWALVDIDVKGLYPDIAVKNRLYPEHLGERFVEEYARLPAERKEWQERKGKKCAEANSMKLASNGTYGNSNNEYSVFFDPKFTMTITVNGQLLLSMLAEWLLTVPSIQLLMINTDGITYRIRRDQMQAAREIQKAWEAYTRLVLEEAHYSRLWLRDVNNYVAESVDGKLKIKGAYWYPDPENYAASISEAQPPAWHKDLSNTIAPMAAVAHMVHGTDIEKFIYSHSNPFDFFLRAKVDRASQLWIGDEQVQRICRYYIAHNGGAMRKVSPPVKGAQVGQWKRKNGISDFEYMTVLQEVGDAWDARIHTANKSKYVVREMGIEAGHLVRECNLASKFDFANLNYDWYVEQAKKLVIG